MSVSKISTRQMCANSQFYESHPKYQNTLSFFQGKSIQTNILLSYPVSLCYPIPMPNQQLKNAKSTLMVKSIDHYKRRPKHIPTYTMVAMFS